MNNEARRTKAKAKATSAPGNAEQMCPTPMGLQRSRAGAEGNDRILTAFTGGTVCTDVSTMGAKAGLLGPSCRSLAIFLSEIKHAKPKVVLHECTSGFVREVFDTYLDEYDVFSIQGPEDWTELNLN